MIGTAPWMEDNPNSDCQGNNIMDDYNNNELF